MPTVRPYWKGYLKLALVSCPIALYTASSSSERVAFRQLNKKTGNRLRQQLVDDVTREPVEAADKGRGYEYAKNSYLLIEDDVATLGVGAGSLSEGVASLGVGAVPLGADVAPLVVDAAPLGADKSAPAVERGSCGRRIGIGRSSAYASAGGAEAPRVKCPMSGDVRSRSEDALAFRVSAARRRPWSRRPCRPGCDGPSSAPCPGRPGPPSPSARRRRSRRRSSCRTAQARG